MTDRNALLAKYPGLLIEKNRNGSPRLRVRVEGESNKRITLDIGPRHPKFQEAYWSARAGEQSEYANDYVSLVEATGDLRKTISAMLSGARRRAKDENVPFMLKRENIIAMINEQGGMCALSGIDLDLSASDTRRRPFAPSIDRIQQGGGYTPQNTRITCVAVNIARSDWPDEVLIRIARGITNNVSRNVK